MLIIECSAQKRKGLSFIARLRGDTKGFSNIMVNGRKYISYACKFQRN